MDACPERVASKCVCSNLFTPPFLNFPFIREIFAVQNSHAVVNLLFNTPSEYVKTGKNITFVL
jgi:hypothetical protein